MTFYIEAWGHDNRSMLGNLDGQACLGKVRDYRRASAVKAIRASGARYSRVKFWTIVDSSDRVYEVYRNFHLPGSVNGNFPRVERGKLVWDKEPAK